MESIYSIFEVIYSQVLTKAPLLLGIVTMIGYIAMRQKADKVIAGTIKTIVGFMLLQQGAGLLIRTFRPILEALSSTYGLTGTIIDPYAGMMATMDAMGDAYAWVGYTVLFALALNIFMVMFKRYTGIRTVMLSGHIMFQQAGIFAWVIYATMGTGMVETILLAGIITALYWGITTNMVFKPTEQVTGGAGFSIGHQQMFGCWLASKVAPHLGNNEEQVDDVELPGWLKIFNDNVAATAIVMLTFFGGIMLALGKDAVTAMAGNTHWVIHIFNTGMMFAVCMTMIVQGVRMFVAELTTSFQGISERLVPGAVVAVDCAAVFGFAPNAVVFGFMFGAIGMLTGVALLIFMGSPYLIIPGFIPMFFDNAVIGVFANHFGGWRAAWKVCLCSGLIQVFGGAWAVSLAGLKDGWLGMFDFATIVPAFIQGMHISSLFIFVVFAGALVYMYRAAKALRAQEDAEKAAELAAA